MLIFKKKINSLGKKVLLFSFFSFLFIFLSTTFLVHAAPVGPDSITTVSNETKGIVAAVEFNISGGYISTFNITSTTQNVRWKAMVGNVSGSFTLDDAAGATIYDWSLSTISGEVYATRNSSTVTWANIACANLSLLEFENIWLNHTNSADNISATFNTTAGATHSEFTVASTTILANTCPTLNTYVGNASQDTSFEEMALTDSTNFSAPGSKIVYSTILEQDTVGFDSERYDFQMIVPENGLETFTSSTAYYLYVELS